MRDSFAPAVDISHYPEDNNHWLITNNTHFSTQWTQCNYPISGQYGLTPRIVYYILILTSVVLRQKTWVASATLASVMTYSGVAATHAVALASMGSRFSSAGIHWVSASLHGDLDLPVLPQVRDRDGDTVFAIVGVAFFAVYSMHIYSETLKASEARMIIVAWTFLLLLGLSTAFFNFNASNSLEVPQYRFCPRSFNETLPVTNSRYDDYGSSVITSWNDTIWAAFDPDIPGGNANRIENRCVYPCLTTKWPLRDQSEITVAYGFSHRAPYSSARLFFRLIAIYLLLYTSLMTCVGISLFIRSKPFLRHRFLALPKSVVSALSVCVRVLDFKACYVDPIVVLVFLAWAEWTLSYAPEGEGFNHIGQWGTIVVLGLAYVAVAISRSTEKEKKEEDAKTSAPAPALTAEHDDDTEEELKIILLGRRKTT